MSLPANAPTWLGRALSDKNYLYTVFDALKDREETRQFAGSAALHSSSNSNFNSDGNSGKRSSGIRPSSASAAKRWSAKITDALKPGLGSGPQAGYGDDRANGEDNDKAHARMLEEHYRISVGAHPANRPHNRYANILPYDRTRVRVNPAAACWRTSPSASPATSVAGNDANDANDANTTTASGLAPPPTTAPFNSFAVRSHGNAHASASASNSSDSSSQWAHESDYLNANWVRELWGGQWYAAAQAPLRETAHAFLSLFLAPGEDARPSRELSPELYQNENENGGRRRRVPRMRTAVQLTVASEGGQTKAHPYFHASAVGRAFVVAPTQQSGSGSGSGSGSVPHLEVRLEKEEQIPRARCVKSVLRVVPCRARPKPGGGLRGHEGSGGGSSNSKRNSGGGGGDDNLHMREYEKTEELGKAVYMTHLLFTHWPDYGVPQGKDKAALVEFTRVVAEVNGRPALRDRNLGEREGKCEGEMRANGIEGEEEDEEDETLPPPPIAINCSAGIGRTGTFIALSSLLRANGFLSSSSSSSASSSSLATFSPRSPSSPQSRLLPQLPPSPLGPLPDRRLTGSVDVAEDPVAQEVDALREQRPMMVQSPAQLMLIYELVAAAFIEADIRKRKSAQSQAM